MSHKGRWLVIGLLVMGILSIGYLVLSNMQHQQYYLTLAELENVKDVVDGKGIRLNATVQPGSIRKTPGRLIYDFVVTDGVRTASVHYRGVVSDMFKDGVEVVVEGRYDARRNHIEATRLMTKCPSKYQADTAS